MFLRRGISSMYIYHCESYGDFREHIVNNIAELLLKVALNTKNQSILWHMWYHVWDLWISCSPRLKFFYFSISNKLWNGEITFLESTKSSKRKRQMGVPCMVTKFAFGVDTKFWSILGFKLSIHYSMIVQSLWFLRRYFNREKSLKLSKG